jgi:hypothetical protein
MRPDAQAVCFGPLDRLSHGQGVTRVEAAGDIHAAQEREQARVVAHAPGAVGLAGVGVQIDGSLHS